MEEVQESYKKALRFAAVKHEGQFVPGTRLPYLVHVTNVAMEVLTAGLHTKDLDLPFAVSVALLHDVIEDTKVIYNEISGEFGNDIADAVLALTKFSNLPKEEQIPDSLKRIRMQRKEVWAVKLADRITNLEAPPLDWDYKKRTKYMNDARLIWNELHTGNRYLGNRLNNKIIDYQQFVHTGEK